MRTPDALCPKCDTYGFLAAKPRYDVDHEIAPLGRLLWECDYCGYTIETPTADMTYGFDDAETSFGSEPVR